MEINCWSTVGLQTIHIRCIEGSRITWLNRVDSASPGIRVKIFEKDAEWITVVEAEKALKSLKVGKADGFDCVTTEYWRLGGHVWYDLLDGVYSVCLNAG